MKIQLVSDLHLEFSPIEIRNAGADLLILSGDICVADYLNRSKDSAYYEYAERFRAFFAQVSAEFGQVLYVMGNHEHYNGTFERSADILRANLPSNIKLLDNEAVTIGGFLFAGATLWTDVNNSNPLDMYTVQTGLNDYNLIKSGYAKFRVGQSIAAHRETMRFLANAKPDVFIGHHLPSYRSISAQYGSDLTNPGYASNLDEFVMDSGIKLWTHGHTHRSTDYMIGNTHILANPRGYARLEGRPENLDFNPSKVWVI